MVEPPYSPHPTDNPILDQAVLNLLPHDFNPGYDGMGATDANQKQAASYFREPWKYTDSDIQTLVRCTKKQFFHLALTCDGAQLRNSSLNVL